MQLAGRNLAGDDPAQAEDTHLQCLPCLSRPGDQGRSRIILNRHEVLPAQRRNDPQYADLLLAGYGVGNRLPTRGRREGHRYPRPLDDKFGRKAAADLHDLLKVIKRLNNVSVRPGDQITRLEPCSVRGASRLNQGDSSGQDVGAKDHQD